jgi:hypothetical protein
LKDVVTASNGDAIVVGSVGNNDGDAKDSGGHENESKAVIMRYSSSGDLKWKKYAGGNMDTFVGVAEVQMALYMHSAISILENYSQHLENVTLVLLNTQATEL